MLWTGEAHQSSNIQTFDGSHKNSPNFLCHFSIISQFSFKFHITHNSCIIFLAETLYSSDKKSYQSANFWSFEFSREKVHQILHVIFETAVHFSFKFCIAL